MSWFFQILYLVVLVFFLILLIRLVFEWIQVFARDWEPRGPVLVVAEVAYTITDPPLRALRRVIPPLRIGRHALDLAFLVLAICCSIAMAILSGLAATT